MLLSMRSDGEGATSFSSSPKISSTASSRLLHPGTAEAVG